MKLIYKFLLIFSSIILFESTSSKLLLENPKNKSIIANGNGKFLKNCIETLIHHKPLLTTNCCLTKLCSNKWLVNNYPTIKELTFKLCSERSYLLKEQLNGCNNQTNFESRLNKENCMKCRKSAEKSAANKGPPLINYRIGSLDDNLTLSTTPSTTPTSNVHMSNVQTDAEEIRFGNNTKTKSATNSSLQFLDVPKGDEMRIHDLKLNEQYLLFEAFSTLIGYLQPSEFPSELIRNAIENQIPFHIFALQLLKTEIVAVGWLLLWALLSICLPFVIVAQLCCMNTNIERLNEDSSNVSLSFSDKCTERTFGFLLHFLLILFLFPLVLILAGNEQISKYISMSTSTTNLIFDDINNFIKNTHMQMTFVATSSTDIAIEAIRKDLEDIKNILGKPVQNDLATEFGIDRALDNLEELKSMNGKVTTLVTDLLNECALAEMAGSRLQEQMREIARQLTIARQQCLPKDRALCYTLQYTGFDVTFSTDNITNDRKIKQLATIGKEINFNNSINKAQIIFSQVPEQVALVTTPFVAEIKTVLSKKRTEVYKSAHKLDELARSISESVKAGHHSALQLIEKASTWDLWRWLTVVGISTILSLVWCLLLCGAPCGCGITSRTIAFLIAGVSLSCIICLVVWSLGTLSYLVGAHCQSLICQTFYDSPHYQALGKLADSNGIISNDGFFDKFVNDSIKIADVLRNCQRNQPIYATFHLKQLFDIQTLTNHKSWTDLLNIFTNFTILENNIELLSPKLQLNLQELLSTISTINLTTYRLKMTEPLTKKDLTSFMDQLNGVARQLSDLKSTKRIDTLAIQMKKIIDNDLKQLNDLRNKILYKITNLEVLLINPLYKKTNDSLIELKNIQYNLDNEGWQITERNNRKFIGKLENYLNDLYNHTTYKITKDIGKCRPLWQIYHSMRFYFCKLLVDPMNGISLLSFLLILLLWGIVPTVIKLIEHYKELNEELLSSITHRRARDGLIIDDEGTWATPSSDSPDLITHTSGPDQPGQSRQPSVPFIPPPPLRPPSNISSRITSPRIPQIPSVSKATSSRRFSNIASKISAVSRVPQIQSRARSPKRGQHESLHLIDPICWKSGSLTPKSWL